jgi:hypothetical protein
MPALLCCWEQQPKEEAMNRRIAAGVVSTRCSSGTLPCGGSVAATIENLCTSNATHKRTRSEAVELTSGMGWSSSVVRGSGRDGRI